MDKSIPNRTHEIYKQVYAYVTVIYVILVQSVYEFAWQISSFENPIANIVINIAFNGVAYFLIYEIVLCIYSAIWKHKNKDCFIAGTWYHIHVKEDDKTYVRWGRITIKQHFYDLSVEGQNQQPVFTPEGELFESPRSITRWKYILSELSDNGNICACYRTSKKSGARRTNKGIHQLMILEHDKKTGYPISITGDFADIVPSTSEGYIWMFRAETNSGNGRKDESGDIYPQGVLKIKKGRYIDMPDAFLSMLNKCVDDSNEAREAIEAQKLKPDAESQLNNIVYNQVF